MRKTRKIWLGVGAFAVIGSGAAAGGPLIEPTTSRLDALRASTDLSVTAHPDRIILAQRAPSDHADAKEDAGEGNEAKHLASLPPELAFAVRIALLRGHLLVGDELVRQQQWNAALPHFLHPGEEIYADIEGELSAYRVPPFANALKALADVVKAKKGGNDYAKAFDAVARALAAADAGMQAKQQGEWAGFVTETAVEAFKTAAGEYEKAIVNGRIAKPVEYQDARGFIWQGSRMIDSVAAELQKKDAAALAQVRAGLAELKQAFPAAMPPTIPVKDAAALAGIVARIELAAGKLM